MSSERYKFQSDKDDDVFLRPPAQSLEKVLGDSRRIDDALLHALSLVLTSNTEYARSVSALLETDLNREQTFNEINTRTKELLEKTQKLIESQEQLKDALESISDEHREVLELLIKGQLETHQKYMDQKFGALFLSAGLKNDGTEHGAADKVVLKFKALLTHEVWVMVIGAILYHLALLAAKHFGG